MGVGGGVGQGGPQAIRTRYSGILFRSRLEARWAVFFDALGVKWEYEKEGYELPSGRYLPDFWLPKFGWAEVKPAEHGAGAWLPLAELCHATQSTGVLLAGSPLDLPDLWSEYEGYQVFYGQGEMSPYFDGASSWGFSGDMQQWPCLCPKCRRLGFEYMGWGNRICGKKCMGDDDGRYPTADAPEIVQAIATVRSHSFWEPGVVDSRRSRRIPTPSCAGYPVGDAGWSEHDDQCPNHRSP